MHFTITSQRVPHGEQPAWDGQLRWLLAGDQPSHDQEQAAVIASAYPSVVSLNPVIVSPYWAGIAHLTDPEEFMDHICENITESWTPRGAYDPLRHWMEEE